MNELDWKTVRSSELYEGLYDGPHATRKLSDSGPDRFLESKLVTSTMDVSISPNTSDLHREEDYAQGTLRRATEHWCSRLKQT